MNGLVFRAVHRSNPRNSNNNDDSDSDSDSGSETSTSTMNSETKEFNKKCRNIAELMEKYLTYAFVIGFTVFCIVMFSKRPEYD